jgi:ABC-type lipoprotein export system ATPase subunit
MSDRRPRVLLRTRALSKHYGAGQSLVRAIDDIDVEIRHGETVAISGPSGCGKSTLLHLLGGLDRPSEGEVWLDEQRLRGMVAGDIVGGGTFAAGPSPADSSGHCSATY